LKDLQDLNFDVALTGFSTEELDALMAPPGTEGLTDPDAVPEAPEHPVSVPGDVWLLGRHRLACGDCTDPLVVEKALAGVKPHLMVTDPPYGVEYDASWRAEVNGDGPNSKRAIGKVLNDDKADWREAWTLFPGDVAYVWHSMLFAHVVANSLVEADFRIRAQIVWAKSQFTFGRGDYHPQHESCWYVVRNGAKGHYEGGRKQSTLWQIEKPRNSETGHSTQKPVECMQRPIENNSSPGQAVYEPFSGSGTTIIAAEMTGRSCHAIELNAAYVDVAIKRWQQFTGQQATLEGDGRSFTDVATERCKAAA
jgi:DNA modification methylase